MKSQDPRLKNLRPGRRPGEPRPNFGAARDRRMAMFARLYTGNLDETLLLCRKDGLVIGRSTGARYLQNPRFVELLRSERAAGPGSGIWTADELKRFYTRVAAGLELEGGHAVAGKPTSEQRAPKMLDRLRAADSLGRSLGAFMERLEVKAEVGINNLLDDDIKPSLPAHPGANLARLWRIVRGRAVKTRHGPSGVAA